MLLLVEVWRDPQEIRVFTHEVVAHAGPLIGDIGKLAILGGDGEVPIPEIAVQFDVGKALHC